MTESQLSTSSQVIKITNNNPSIVVKQDEPVLPTSSPWKQEEEVEGASNHPYRINNCKFQNSIISYLSELYNSKEHVDVVLHAGDGKVLRCHKIVLAAGSSYFNTLFKSVNQAVTDQPSSSSPLVVVVALPSTVKYKDLELVVRFMYSGWIEIGTQDLDSFVGLCKELGVVGMVTDDDDDNDDEDNNGGVAEDTQQHEGEVLCATTSQLVNDDDDDDEAGCHGDDDTNKDGSSSSVMATALSNQNYQQIVEIDMMDDDEEEDEDVGEIVDDDDDDDEQYYEEFGGNHNIRNNVGTTPQTNATIFKTSSSSSSSAMVTKPFACTKCGKTYNSNKSLWRHKKFTCDEKIEFKCGVCGKVFSRSDNLRRHCIVAHHHNNSHHSNNQY